ncbi:hypothetical protein A2707_03425 [Candidatus Saccharibacteria bacterium RIFCSPHIGHO2_01_FULL_45_15]|nr:MAG: hypothetical protein A2707_03425 [Candidatus Saccharibacteria bacterium RIFCSPHIGHO2_01_FULL_45_15]OGL32451.1 MAG: hypothetical protein A3E76_00145 [Candidatus Saccharibacteria bacterium RIFCSPHIGHO2_12_FULL_44_22]
MTDNYKSNQQLILARDIIDMAREYSDDHDALEYLRDFTFCIARMTDGGEKEVVDWNTIHAALDQAWHNNDSRAITQLDSVYIIIESRLDQ